MLHFPEEIALGAQASLAFDNTVTQLANGREIRNQSRRAPRRRYNVSTGINSLDELATVAEFFTAHGGTQKPFLFKDISDHNSSKPSLSIRADDQVLAEGDGKTATFQLVKSNRFGGYRRPIRNPIGSSVRVMIEDQEVVNGQHFIVDDMSGLITFYTPPEAGARITAGFEFMTLVRFESNEIEMVYENFNSGNAVNIALIEVNEGSDYGWID